MQHSPCLSMKLTLAQDARKAHVCTKSNRFHDEHCIIHEQVCYPKSILSRCTTTLN